MTRFKLLIIGIAIFAIAGILFAPMVHAQEGEGDAVAAGGEERTVMDDIISAGPIGFIIILLSVISMALIIEHFVALNRNKLLPPAPMGDVEAMIDEDDIDGAIDYCAAEPPNNIFCSIMEKSLSRVDLGYEAMADAAAEATDEQVMKLQQKISYLTLIGSISPMLGLLGTVTGMIGAFAKIAAMAGAANAADLADNISQALMTTCLGLIVAIPSMSAFFFFKNRIQKFVAEAAATSQDILDRFRTPV